MAGHFHGLPIAVKYFQLQDVRRLCREVSADPEPSAGKRRDAGLHPRSPLEGRHFAPSEITFYRPQCDSEGTCGPAAKASTPGGHPLFGGIGILPSLKCQACLTRHVLPRRSPPRAVAFALSLRRRSFEVLKYFGVGRYRFLQPKPKSLPLSHILSTLGLREMISSKNWNLQSKNFTESKIVAVNFCTVENIQWKVYSSFLSAFFHYLWIIKNNAKSKNRIS